MLKLLRLIFPRPDERPDDGLRRLWASLVRVGLARGLALADAEDLAQESVVAGMQGYDPARGDFGAYCRTIMANRTASFHRAARPVEPIPEDGGDHEDPDGGPAWAVYERQCRERADRAVAGAIAGLDEEEAGFLMILASVYEERDHGEVSEAARRAGIRPQKGWDLFRRIQRHFKAVGEEIPRPAVHDDGVRFCSTRRAPRGAPRVHELPAPPPPPPPDIEIEDGTFLFHLRDRYARFDAGLAEGDRARLLSLLRR